MARKKQERAAPVIDTDEVSLQEIESQYELHPGQTILDDQVFKLKRKRIFAQC